MTTATALVVLFLHGGCDQAPVPFIVPTCAEIWQTNAAIVAEAVRVPAVFAVCGVLEHAPPWRVRASVVRFPDVA